MPTETTPSAIGEPAKAQSVKLIAPADLFIAFGLTIAAAIAWALPERYWRRLCASFAPLSLRMLSPDPERTKRAIGETLGDRPVACSPETIVRNLAAADIETTFQCLRDYRPGGWNAALRLRGQAHIEAALERGNGVILWISEFSFRSLPTKMAFHRAGIPVSHLSHPRHGFSGTRFGMAVLNPVRSAREDRYLAERVMLSLDGPIGAMRVLRRRLRENRVVSITVGGAARHPVSVPFLDGNLELATGAPDLAFRTKAVLLPVFSVRDEAGLITVEVTPPLEVPVSVPRAEAMEVVMKRFAQVFETWILKYPDQWMGWFDL